MPSAQPTRCSGPAHHPIMQNTIIMTHIVRRTVPSVAIKCTRSAALFSTSCHHRQSGTELHPHRPTILEPERTVDTPYDNESRVAFEDWVQMHPIYTQADLHSVKVVHHEIKETPDRIADWIVRFCRWGTDKATNYKHHTPEQISQEEQRIGHPLSVQELRERKLIMTPDEWLLRTLFLESIAGVPGMVGGVLRHLRSLRLLKRDGGWIHTLLQEAENERMHLLCFMTVKQPSRLFRFLVMGAQGVFTNMLFLLYIMSPRSVHRFVQRLEAEAVYTYTLLLEEIESGRFPEWASLRAPQIAIDYWRLPEGQQSMKDMIYAIRADESTHRFVNGTLANLQPQDVNPFGLSEPPAAIRGAQAEFSREEAMQWLDENAAKARLRHEDTSSR